MCRQDGATHRSGGVGDGEDRHPGPTRASQDWQSLGTGWKPPIEQFRNLLLIYLS